jgi:phosphatidylserine/phosphatidylglycerophosphate/cardiolipin synthase-like enzyme
MRSGRVVVVAMFVLAVALVSVIRWESANLHPSVTPLPPANVRLVTENHFAPGEDLERIDLARLESAQKSVDVAMYAFTDRMLAEELVALAQRGVVIRIYRDKEQYEEEERRRGRNGPTSDMFTGQRNIHLRVKPQGGRDLMHLKAYVVDGVLLRDGSANWSISGLKDQDNNARFTNDPIEIQQFEQDFEAMWSRPGNLQVQ